MIELVRVLDLRPGDWIMLDDGHEAQVRAIDCARGSKDAARVSLRGRPPLNVHGYWRPIVRRVLDGDAGK